MLKLALSFIKFVEVQLHVHHMLVHCPKVINVTGLPILIIIIII